MILMTIFLYLLIGTIVVLSIKKNNWDTAGKQSLQNLETKGKKFNKSKEEIKYAQNGAANFSKVIGTLIWPILIISILRDKLVQ